MLRQSLSKVLPNWLKVVLRNTRNAHRKWKRKKTRHHVDKAAIKAALADIGIKKGDTIFVHSSISGLGYVKGGPETVIHALQEAVGRDGNLLLPTYFINRSTIETLLDRDYVFDPKSTPSVLGAVSNAFWKQPQTFRSLHPTHSVTAWGHDAENLVKYHHTDQTAFGPNSPFQKIRDIGGKIVGLGINMGPVSYYHVYEDINPHLFEGIYLDETFSGRVVGPDGVVLTVPVRCHSPDFHENRIDKTPEIERFFRQHFDEKQARRHSDLGGGEVWAVDCNTMLEIVGDLCAKGYTIYKVD